MKIISWDIGIKNLAYCKLEDDKIIDWNTISLIGEDEKVKKITLNILTDRLITKFYNTLDLFDIDYVLLENQPCLKNPIMKSLQMIIYTIYNIEKYNNNRIKDILLINATNKLKVYTGPPIKIDVKSSYQKRKKLSIIHAQYFLKNSNQERILSNINKKKIDDLCDTYLQGLYFYKKMSESQIVNNKRGKKVKALEMEEIFIEDVELGTVEEEEIEEEENELEV